MGDAAAGITVIMLLSNYFMQKLDTRHVLYHLHNYVKKSLSLCAAMLNEFQNKIDSLQTELSAVKVSSHTQ